MSKLNKEAIDEIMTVLNEVKDVVRLLCEFNIDINSDCWSATSPVNHDYEDILSWDRKHFETLDMTNIKSFTIGGNIITGSQHQYKDKWIIAPKKLAEIQGEIFKDYLQSIIKSISLKHFELKLSEPYGLVNNCGWEHFFCIDATIKTSALKSEYTKQLIEKIREEQDSIIELGASPLYDNPKNNFHKDSNLVPNGEFAYMLEFFSTSLVCQDDGDYLGCFSNNDYNGKYIRDAMALINNVEKRAKELADKYADKGVKVTIGDFNEGCQYGMAVYVWIPYQ